MLFTLILFVTCAAIPDTLLALLVQGNSAKTEVAGAAYATVLARLTELLLFLCYVKKTKPPFYARLRQVFKINAALFRTILKTSVLIFFADIDWVMSETVVTAVYNSRGGPKVVSGMSAGLTIANIFFLVFPAIRTAVGGILGRNAAGFYRLLYAAVLLYCFTALSSPVMYALSKSTTIVKAVLAHRQLKKILGQKFNGITKGMVIVPHHSTVTTANKGYRRCVLGILL